MKSNAGWSNMVQIGMVMAEAQAVIGMRMLGMAGLWNVAPGENRRMVLEKGAALVQSAERASAAMMSGEGPNRIAAAAIKPIRQRTRANVRRLAKRSVKKG